MIWNLDYEIERIQYREVWTKGLEEIITEEDGLWILNECSMLEPGLWRLGG